VGKWYVFPLLQFIGAHFADNQMCECLSSQNVQHPLLQMFLDGDVPFIVLLLKVDQYADIGNKFLKR
jgi:hypothetical protein